LKVVAAAAVAAALFFAAGAGQSATVATACGPPTSTVAVPASGAFGMKALADLWVAHGGPVDDANGDGYGDAVEAAAIATAESGGDPTARNSIGATGLWQIYNGPGTSLSLKDPDSNAAAAVAKYRDKQRQGLDGFTPWTTYTGADTGPGGGPGPRTFLTYLRGAGPAETGSTDLATCVAGTGSPGLAGAEEILRTPEVRLMPGVPLSGVDPRVLGLLRWLSRDHTMVVTATTNGGHAEHSNHYAGRAVDLDMIDGHLCGPSYGPADSCGRMAIEVAALPTTERPTEIISCFDADGPGPAFARADHCDHIHFGWDR
jgi:hypothetical protein